MLKWPEAHSFLDIPSMSATYAWMLVLCLGFALGNAAIIQGQETAVGPPPDLAQDLTDVYGQIQLKPMQKLFVRYLLNDGQFQAFVRILNSNAGFTAYWRLLAQPEVLLFRQWVDQQLLASSGKFELEPVEVCTSLVNRYPYLSGTVFGWQGFLNELEMYFPLYAINAQVQLKVQQGGIFAQFYQRLSALKAVYERWLATPITQTVLSQLQAEGIDTDQLDTIVRDLFGWQVTNTTAATLRPTPTVPDGAVMMPGAPLVI
ncbi:hypothetical protein AWZ03_000967 [Drosophila navojoa]|uniref:Uncharacterized protein n=1 Tax=Drosophila navojoa TaxID=7232 RepID=A0A484BVP1_DRONA|nr:protein G12 [Drosophila navojoa]TDG52734.1 hypothetical protein AWZ03_000967 [Drosophila navojoa]